MNNEEKLKDAKRLYQTANSDQKYVLESLFPELKESEDEKIRKWLIDWAKAVNWSELFPISKGQVLAWLEKQGEPLSVDVESMVESYQKRLANKYNASVECPLVKICLTSFRHGVENTMDELKLNDLNKRKE